MNYIETFSRLGFDFKVDFESMNIDIEREPTLTAKLHNAVFFYKSPDNTNTSFYLLTTILSTDEIDEIRKYIWNKNDADLIFYYPNEDREFEMLYAKYSPKINYKESILESFSTSQKDLAKLEKIKHWQFDSGVFWLNYQSSIDKAKYKGIDKELVLTLKALKEKLYNILSSLISEENELNKVVQALIDRTLYIKFLEDNHIINSHFYDHYFKDSTLNYGRLLEEKSNTDINKLFKIIHEIFNNALFDQPTIDDVFLTEAVCKLIGASFKANLQTGQLRLFDFQFDVLPVEFISSIYEVFLSEKQKENGIYYTPKKLAQLIVDDVIAEDRIGSILDPSCGSGMFLIIGFQRLLEIAQKLKKEPENNIEKIEYRIELLSKNIFGIEKELTAQRFTLFSLSLQILKNIPAEEIKLFIENELKQNNEIKIFKKYDFYKNIIHQNTLDFVNPAFEGRTFDYIVGNPPFVRKEVSVEAKNFTNNYQLEHLGNIHIAKNIIDGYQISQCFLLKIKEWSNRATRFGFVSNSSNFYNDAEKFQKFFYSNYGIEKIYELSRVKDILFEKAKESIVAIIFNNNYQNNVIDYYSVEKGLFSEKPFELLIIQMDKAIQIEQEKLIEKQLRLRDFLVGNECERNFVSHIYNQNDTLGNYISILKNSKSKINNGLQIVGKEQILTEFRVTENEWQKLTKKERQIFSLEFKKKYTSRFSSVDFPFPLLEPKDLLKYRYSKPRIYLGDISNFQRTRNNIIYSHSKVLINRTGNELNAVVSLDNVYYNFDVYSIFLNDNKNIYLFAALINSFLINYFIDLSYRKRVDGSFPKIGYDAILNIPIPKELDHELVTRISNISKDLTEGKFEYGEKEEELNGLIYDLFELSYIERQRIKDYFLPDAKKPTTPSIIKNYEDALKDTIEFYFSQKITIENVNAFNLRVIKICFGAEDNPTAKKVGLYTLEQIFKEYQKGKFFLDQECIFGKDCVYILKKDINQNWTETKAFEDGQDILKHLIPNGNGKRIH